MMRRLAALWLGAALAVLAPGARADTPVTLFSSVAGNVNFVGTQKTMRDRDNSKGPCSVVSAATTLTASLSGIPDGAEILSAHLYWAGSGTKAAADYKVNFEGAAVTAPLARQYFSSTIGSGYSYFGGAADVKAQVAQKRNGSYSFSGLTINNGKPWCATQAVVGGFSLLVVYSDPNEAFRVLNVYEGFQYIANSNITLNLSNFRVPNPLPARATGRLGHITWEGDQTLKNNGEELRFNGYEMVDLLNDAGNQFNSKSNINNDAASYGIDFDAYTIQAPTIAAGQTSARTRYESGQDLVLLNAEIIAVPNEPTADLALSLARSGELQAGGTGSYVVRVSNLGPLTDPGPITVVVTLPDGMNYESAAGDNWSCTRKSQKITCSTAGPLNKGAALAPITLNVVPQSKIRYTVTAEVAGKLFDNVLGNNTASDISSAVEARNDGYVFTVGSCKTNIAIGSPDQCSAFAGTIDAGVEREVYITALSDTGLPSPPNTKAGTTVSMRFSLSCDVPGTSAGTGGLYGGVSLPICAQGNAFPASGDDAWSQPTSVTFAANAASAMPGNGKFSYDDVGKILLNLVADSGSGGSGNGNNGNGNGNGNGNTGGSTEGTASTTLVSRPLSVEFEIRRNVDGVANPAATPGDGRGFVRAGEEFTLRIGARTKSGRFAPNFHLEANIFQDGDELTQARLTGDFQPLAQGVRLGTNFVWDDVGVLEIKPSLAPNDYLGTGQLTLTPQKVGRFYPAYFRTTTESNFACLPPMACPTGISGAAYSREPFKVTIAAFSLKDSLLVNYKGALVRDIALSAVAQPGAEPAAGALSGVLLPGSAAPTALEREPAYRLPTPFDAATPRAAWGAPATIYLRASSDEPLAGLNNAPGKATVSSKREAGVPSVEGGMRIVNGRLQLSHAFGSELLRLPVPMQAQYWSGSAWVNNSGDNNSKVEFFVDYTSCDRKLALAGRVGENNCNADLLKSQSPSAVLKDGAGKLWLAAPGPGNPGSAWLKIKADFPEWLPSTRARAVFGVHKSPLIYVREVY